MGLAIVLVVVAGAVGTMGNTGAYTGDYGYRQPGTVEYLGTDVNGAPVYVEYQ